VKLDWKLIGICVAAVLLVFGGYEILQSHDAAIKARSVQDAQQQVIATAQKQIDQAKADEQQTAAQLQARIAELEKEKQQPVTPDQFIAALQRLTPLPQQPVVVRIPASGPGTAADGKPAAAAAPQTAIQIPAADLPALRDYKVACDETGAKLGACQLDAAANATQVAALEAQLKSTEAERDQWKSASKGGSWLHRLKGDMKCIAIMSAASAAGTLLDKKSPAAGAAIGAAGGEVGSRIF
jgi:type II secretory pathway pseudopilin PulG